MKVRIGCRHCGAETENAFHIQDINRRIGSGRFPYVRCKNCGLLFLENPPEDIGSYYPPEYYVIPKSVAELASWSVSEQYKIDLVRRFRTSGRLIEIGPASGGFCYLSKAAGFDVSAIEMDRRSCQFLSSKLGIEVLESADEAAALQTAEPADVIAMWHVIEHLVDPWSMLEVAAGKLRPGGVLVLATPNPNALQFALLGRRWVHVDAPRHLWLLPSEVIEERARGLGLTVRLTTTRDTGSMRWNRFGWEYTLMNMFLHPVLRRMAGIIGRLIAAVASPFEHREGRGAAYTIVLQKPSE